MRSSKALILTLATALAACTQSGPETTTEGTEPGAGPLDAEAIIVGAGISGLSAAVEMGREDVEVLLIDMNTVPGGHAVMAGGFAVVGTPVQEREGYEDSADLAFADWQEWTVDGDPEWTRFYAENSRELIYDWAEELGTEWVRVAGGYENSVPRFHFTPKRAMDYVRVLVKAALDRPNVNFLYNQEVERLTVEDGRIVGVEITDLRTGTERSLRGEHVVLATGGVEGDLDHVLSNWMPNLPKPDRLLVGSSRHALGQGLGLAEEAGASLTMLDRHYIYTNGIVNIDDPDGVLAVTAANGLSMWVNSHGQRFTNETGRDKDILVDLLNQDDTTYWAVFDETSRDGVSMRGVEWIYSPSDGHPLIDNPETTRKANSLEELAEMTELPADALVASVERFNAMVAAGKDEDFNRFDNKEDAPHQVVQAPFYAMQFFPMTRKTMGGVSIDMDGRAIDANGDPVPGLYAIGELTGSVGINGSHGMDGMFLGPAVVTGRVAGRTIAESYGDRMKAQVMSAWSMDDPLPDAETWEPSMTATELEALLAIPRDGYWHFEMSHDLVLERNYQCADCHSAEVPFMAISNRESKQAQIELCSTCHGH